MIVPAGARWTFFGAYASGLFVATHWPRLSIDSPVRGIDKLIHLAVFCIWTLLLGCATRAGRRGWTLTTLWTISTLYAAFDEGLQAIPALGRTCSFGDLAANVAGITVATGILAVARPALHRSECPS